MLRWCRCRCRSDHTQAGRSGVHVPGGRRRVSASMCRMAPALAARTSSSAWWISFSSFAVIMDFSSSGCGPSVAVSLERRACRGRIRSWCRRSTESASRRPSVVQAISELLNGLWFAPGPSCRGRPRAALPAGPDRTRQWRSLSTPSSALEARRPRSRHRSGNDVQPLPGVSSRHVLPSSSRPAKRRMSLNLAGR